ncbi:nucleoside phosphorylase domain-containing protein [Aspergillus navahoensis]
MTGDLDTTFNCLLEMTAPEWSHKDYTVGWICALSIENAVSKAMLDRLHPALPQPKNNQNVYTLGELHGNNVVIACLPSGVYGTWSASIIATQMLNMFPAIRFSLLVGIGGGVPSNGLDIRLGDVMVKKPTNIYGGVVQYDYGKAIAFSRSSDCPLIHYGVIASESQVMRDGLVRDQISRELGDAVMCFGMEAAGLIDDPPCLVIRGICDYADSHKNKRWQPCAAAMASAYAKELLTVIPVIELSQAPEALEYVRDQQPVDAPDEEGMDKAVISDCVQTKVRLMDPVHRQTILTLAGIPNNCLQLLCPEWS